MDWVVQHVKRLFGVADAFDADPVTSRGARPQIKVKIAVGAALIAGILIVALSILGSTIASTTTSVNVPAELTVSPSSQLALDESDFGSVMIHVIGEVNSPGIYELEAESRVIDAVMAAGGLTSTSAECGVNLARVVKDGEQINIPSREFGCNQAGPPSQSSIISLNQASAEQFDSLPGIGPTLAARIIQWRDSNGGFGSIDQLNDVSGIGDKLFAGIKDLVSL